ncbi:MAG TPA: hypothetical protein VHB21_13640, partial [Minicystis sp.]|nr:hypothetical protein [Minicystis sp.]
HVDGRDAKTGSVSWIDASGPGQAPHYVSSWPPPSPRATDPRPDDHADAPVDDESHDDVTSDDLPRKYLGEVPDHPAR